MTVTVFRHSVGLLCALVPAALCGAQSLPRTSALSVAGQTGEAPVVQVGGRSYVDVEALTRLLNGSLRFQGSRIVLTVPASSSAVAAPAVSAPVQAAASAGVSREFAMTAVGALSAIRDWRATLTYAVQHNQPVSDELLSPSRRQAESQVALAVAAARNDQDRSAAALLNNELGNLRTLSGNYQGTHDSITNIRTDALDNDPLSAKVRDCLLALSSMTAGSQVDDIPSCH